MSGQRFAIIDPAAGVSGDMLLGALVDVGLPREWLAGLPQRLGLEDVTVDCADVMRAGIRATKVTVRLGGAIEGPADVLLTETEQGHHHPDREGSADHPHHHHHHHHDGERHPADHDGHPHRHVGELMEMIARADLTPSVRLRATAAFRLLAAAESTVHGVAPDDVALHEVGALDALVDIVGAIEGFEQLGLADVRRRPLTLGSGWVRTAHGVLPVPTPATQLLVEGLDVGPNGPVTGEATTPTGAALLQVLTSSAPGGAWRAVKSGWGAGSRDPAGYPNALRIVVAEPVTVGGDEIVTLVADLDDLNPEYLDPLKDALLAAGAVDVQSWATQGKKGRTGFRVEALAPAAAAGGVTDAFFRHSSTGGVRRWRADRTTLERELWELETDDGARVRVKTLHGPDGVRVKPEFDDVVAAARRTGRPAHELSRKYLDLALRQVRAGHGGEQPVPKKES
jgi:pyridinium-3,5-bisthiocarboxylic acid mononucleotide nickel chelatase